jgi:outer membrane immunogenic protein
VLHLPRALALSVVVVSAALLLSLGEAGAQGAPAPNPAFGMNSARAGSFDAGGHAGYNWQSGAAVFGFETDIQGTHLNSAMNGGLTHNPALPLPPPGDFATTSAVVDWYGTLRGRLGWTNGPWLLYGSAGLAYGDVGLSSTFDTLGKLTSAQTSGVRSGWVAGAGLDYWLSPSWIFNIQYQHVDLGTVGVSSAAGPFGFPGGFVVSMSQQASAHAHFDAVMAGLTWRFAPAGLVRSWAGGYVGGQAGGAWGNNADATYASSTTRTLVPSDARLKREITLLGVRPDGLGIYSYKYLWSDAVYVGVIAQEVALIHPGAIARDELTGYLSVDYGRLGLPLMMLR